MPSLVKNGASQVVYFGIVNASTGAALAGVTVAGYIAKDGGVQALVGNTVVNDGNGQYHYPFLQAETNATAVGVFFTSSTGVPVSVHFYTDVVDANGFPSVNVADILGTASAGAAGYVGPDWGHVNAPTTTVALTGTTISTSQAIASVSGAVGSVTGNVGGSVASVTAGVTVTTNNDKTGYSLTQTFPANFSALAITAGGAVTVGTNNDKTGYSLTQAFPSNFSALAITAGGVVTANTTQLAGQTVSAAAGVTFPSSVASPTNITAGTITTTTNLTNAPTAGDFTAAMKTSLNAATPVVTISGVTFPTNFSALAISGGGAITVGGYSAGEDPATLVLGATAATWNGAGTIGAKINAAGNYADPWSVSLPGGYTSGQAGYIVGTNLDTNVGSRATAASILTTQLAESYAVLHTTPTLSQIVFEMRGLLAEKSVTGTIMTVNGINGSTAEETFTLNNATAPTAITRAS